MHFLNKQLNLLDTILKNTLPILLIIHLNIYLNLHAFSDKKILPRKKVNVSNTFKKYKNYHVFLFFSSPEPKAQR